MVRGCGSGKEGYLCDGLLAICVRVAVLYTHTQARVAKVPYVRTSADHHVRTYGGFTRIRARDDVRMRIHALCLARISFALALTPLVMLIWVLSN